MADCNHECSSCASSGGCQEKEQNERAINNTKGVKKVIGVVGGKGGVGKSLVTSLLAIQTRRLGYETAVLDADITGPSIPKIFGIHDHAQTDEQNLLPYIAADGTKVMSLNLLLENETDPVFWRGPVISGVVKQFWEEVSWGDVDFMFVDMPPGTGDVPLTVFQSLPLDGIIASSEPAALGTLYALKRAGLRVPQDVKIVSFDSTLYSLLTDPPLTSIERNPQSIAQKSCELILQMMRGEPPAETEIYIPTNLVERASTDG